MPTSVPKLSAFSWKVLIIIMVKLSLVSSIVQGYNIHRGFSGRLQSLARQLSARRTVIELVPGKSLLFKQGNPLVFSKAVANGSAELGEDVNVADHRGNVFARGFFNPLSQYRVRLTAIQGDPCFEYSTDKLIRYRIASAVRKRKAMNLPNTETNAYRLVNGEGDQLSGLVIDVLNEDIVVQSSALWAEVHANSIVQALVGELNVPIERVQWKAAQQRLIQDGIEKTEVVNSYRSSDDDVNDGPASSRIVKEWGISYLAGEQKTGFYCDQRMNRKMLRDLVQGKSVLDAYCYTGGFALNALAGGASSVVAIDSSQLVIDIAKQNAQLNGYLPANEEQNGRIQFLAGDALKEMAKLKLSKQSFDVVILDPPKLAPTRNVLDKALRKYRSINMAGMSLVNAEGGLLLTCTCSAAVSQQPERFMAMLNEAALMVGRRLTILQVLGAAGDHTVSPSYHEGTYLTAVLLYVE